ncbi:MAG: cytochrome c oxidase subunit 3 family protein, partial [bacterium]
MNHTAELTAEHHRDYVGTKFGMWLFLFTEILLFTGLFLLYSVFRSQYAPD